MKNLITYRKYAPIHYLLLLIAVFCIGMCTNSAKAADTDISGKRVMNLKSINHGADHVEFGWDSLADVDGYEIMRLDKVTNGYDVIGTTSENEYKIDGLGHGTSLSILVRPFKSEGTAKKYGLFSDMLTIGTTPDDITGLQAACSGSSIIVLNWNKVSDDASYLIYRCAEGQTEFSQVANVKTNIYQDVSVKPSTGYTYKVIAYVNDINTRCANEAVIDTATCPDAVFINQYKGGSECVRLRWDKVSVADGYIIYIRESYEGYRELVRINDISVKEYIQRDLKSGVTYHFEIAPYKIYKGKEYIAEMSNEVDIKALTMKPTSTKAAVYKNNKKLKKSGLYKKYVDFAKALNLKKTIVAPGIINTNVNGFASSGMVIQAVTNAGNYILMTAYDQSGEENSVIYVISRKTGKYITTILLPDAYHVGGIAYDGVNVWVSAGSSLQCFEFKYVKVAAACGQDFYSVNYKVTCPVLTQASFVTYYKGCLWVGEHKETSGTTMYGYKISGKKSTPEIKKQYSMNIPSRTQDVLFLSNGTMIVSCSNQISSASKYYISCLRRYKPAFGKKKKGKIKLGKSTGKFTMPPMLEGIAYKKGYLYTSFESAGIAGCKYKMDRICALKYSKIKWSK